MNVGLCPGNYFDYEDDEMAIQREKEIASEIETRWNDPTFPADGRSLYFDPMNPPKGSIPNECICWYRISSGEVAGCENPVLFLADPGTSALISPGALGDQYFVNALRALSCQRQFIERLIVSHIFSHIGMYTFKFFKGAILNFSIISLETNYFELTQILNYPVMQLVAGDMYTLMIEFHAGRENSFSKV